METLLHRAEPTIAYLTSRALRAAESRQHVVLSVVLERLDGIWDLAIGLHDRQFAQRVIRAQCWLRAMDAHLGNQQLIITDALSNLMWGAPAGGAQ